jgi:hypothetical protein
MKAGEKINYDDDMVVVLDGKNVLCRGIEDYNPYSNAPWKFIVTTKDGRCHYEYFDRVLHHTITMWKVS